MTGLPCRAPTLVAVAISILRCTCWRVCFWSPLLRMLSTNLLAVPWYKHSGGTWGCNSNVTASECPWLARIFVLSSLKAYRCLLLVATISSNILRLNTGNLRFIFLMSIFTSAQPCVSRLIPIASGWCRSTKLRNLLSFLCFSSLDIVQYFARFAGFLRAFLTVF